MRVYYDAEGAVITIEEFRAGEDGLDEPSPGDYVNVPDVDYTQYDPQDYYVVDGVLIKYSQEYIDARIQAEADFEQLTQDRFDAQEKFNGRVGEAIDLILFFIDTVHSDDLLPAWKTKLDSIRADYAAWEALKD